MKTKNSKQSVIIYLRELSVVVIGIAITLGISSWINHRNSKKEHEQYLNTLKLELRTNVEIIENEIDLLDKSVNYSQYLLSKDGESLDPDTIQKYQYAITQLRDPKLKYNAFEMFKSSGNMRLISNKDLQLSIWDVYDKIDDFRDEFRAYYRHKEDLHNQEVLSKLGEKNISLTMYDFFATGYPVNLQKRCKEALKSLKEEVNRLEKTL